MSRTGAETSGNVLTLHFVDALRGDDVLIKASMVIDLGAPGFTATDNEDNESFTLQHISKI